MVKTQQATARKLLMMPPQCLQRKGSWKGKVFQRQLTLTLVTANRWLRFLFMLHLNTQILPVIQHRAYALLTVTPAHSLNKSISKVLAASASVQSF